MSVEPDRAAVASDERWLTRGVAGIGAASFFSDAGHEITTALLPTFVSSILKAPAATLGFIEGVSDALVGIAKIVGGPLANDEVRRLRMARGGYLGTALATGAIGATVATWQVAILRAFAWLSRGLRSPARDAMVTQLAPQHAYGRAFGFERASDNLGAVAGPLIAAALVGWLGVRSTLALSAVPGLLAAVAITIASVEARKRPSRSVLARSASPPARSERTIARLRRTMVPRGLGRLLVPIAAFELGNMATTLLILRATTLLHHGDRSFTAATTLAIVLYAAHNLAGSVAAYLGGHWIDRRDTRIAFVSGALVYALSYLLFAMPSRGPSLAVAFVFAGVGVGLTETAESTMFAQLVPSHLRGSGFGVLGGVQAFGDFASSAVVGLLWTTVGPAVAFPYAAVWVTVAALIAVVRPPTPVRHRSGATG